MKKIISIALTLGMTVSLMSGLSGCGTKPNPNNNDSNNGSSNHSSTISKITSADEKVKLVSDTVNGMTLNVPDDLSEFTDTNGIMRAKNDDSTASIAISAAKDAGGSLPEAYTEEIYQTSQMTTYTDVKFIEFNNKATLDGVPAVYAHTTGKNPNGVQLELYNYIIFFEDGNFQSIVIVFSEGSNTFLEKNIQAVLSSIKLSM